MAEVDETVGTAGKHAPRKAVARGDGAPAPAGQAASPEALRELLDAAADWTWETDAELRFSRLSDNYQAATGIEPASILGRFRFDFLKQVLKGSHSAAAHLEDLQARRPFRDFVYELKGGRSDCRWVSITGLPRFDGEGNFAGYRGVGRNVTALASAFEELGQNGVQRGEGSEQHLADLERTMDAMHMGVVLLDARLDTLIVNKAYRELSRIPDGAVTVGAPFSLLMELNRRNGIYGDLDEQQWQRYLATRIEEIRAGSVAPREFLHANGRTMMFSVTALSGGRRLLTYYDVTEVKRRDAEIESANAKITETFANLRTMVDQMPIGVLVLDADMRAEVINRAFYDFWEIDPKRAGIGCGFRELMQASRDTDPYGTDDAVWQSHIVEREAEIMAGVAGSRQLPRNDGRTLIASLAPLAGGKRLISYVDVTEMKDREAELAEALEKSRLAEAVIKRRETEAEEARKNLATVLESLPAAVIIYDRDDNFVFANRKLQDTLPALKPAWQPGHSFREALELGHSAGYFRLSGDPEIDRLYDGDLEVWLDAILARYRLPNSSYERLNPDGRWYQVYDMRTDDGTFIGVRVDISDIKSREKALHELDAPDRPVPARHGRIAGGGLHQGPGPQHRIRQQGLVRADRHCQGGSHRPNRPPAVRHRGCRKLQPRRHRGRGHRQGLGGRGAGYPSRRHAAAIDDAQEPAGGARRVGASGRLQHRHHRRQGARAGAGREHARERGVPQPHRQCAGVDLRQALRPQAVLRQQGLVRSHRLCQGGGDRQDRRRDLRTGRRSLRRQRPRRAAHGRDAGDRGDRDAGRRQRAAPVRAQGRDDRVRRLALSDRLDHRHHRTEAARGRAAARRASAPCLPTAPSRNSWPI